MSEENLIYELGRRDAFCELFMLIRKDGIEKSLNTFAEMVKDNCHAAHSLKNKG